MAVTINYMPTKWRDKIKSLMEVASMEKSKYQEIFDLLAEAEMGLFYATRNPGEMPVEDVEEVHQKVKDALVEWNHLSSFIVEG